MSVQNVRSLLPRLPSPVACYETPEVRFEMYRAKDAGSKFWNDPVLKELVFEARSSYSKYGKRPQFDIYDDKAAIYIVRASYEREVSGRPTEEWLSIRLIPGAGSPLGGGELEIYRHQGRPLDYLLAKQLSLSEKDEAFWSQVVSSSRMCGIHPYTQKAYATRQGEKHRFTAICFALIHVQFLLDYPLSQYPCKFVTAIIRSELWQRGLKVVDKIGCEFRPAFTPAYRTLGLQRPEEVELDRATYAYAFPAYWFDLEKLAEVIGRLIREGRLTKVTATHYVRSSLTGNVGLTRLGELLTVNGQLIGSLLTGEELRSIVDAEVPIEPELKIMDVEPWNQSLIAMVRAVGIDIPNPK